MTADMTPPGAGGAPLPPDAGQIDPQAPPDPQAAPAAPEPALPHVDIEQDVKQAIVAGTVAAKAFATGQPDGIDVGKYREAMQGVQAGLVGLAAIRPPTRSVDPNAMQADATRAAAAVLQDHQHQDQMRVQLETASRREGRPSGQTKPVTSKQ